MCVAPAVRLNVMVPAGPPIPGTAARAPSARNGTKASTAPCRSRRDLAVLGVRRIDALLNRAGLGLGVDRSADVDFSHHAAEVLGVVRQVIQIRAVEVELLPDFRAG